MNRVERLTAILLLLQQSPHTSEALAQKFEISKRTVLRDVQALSEMGVPVIAREGAGGGYSLPDDYRMPDLPLNTREVFLLLFALSSLAGLDNGVFRTARDTLLAKLRGALPITPQQEAGILLEAIEMQRVRPAQDARFLEPVLQAIHNKSWLQIGYRSARRPSMQLIFPRRVLAEDGLWLCDAYAHEHAEDRRYRIDRITAVTPKSDMQAAVPAEHPYQHPDHPRIQFELTPRGVALLDSQRDFAGKLVVQANGHGHVIFRCPPAELDYYARILAGLGDEVDVLGPPALREKLEGLGLKLVRRYKKR